MMTSGSRAVPTGSCLYLASHVPYKRSVDHPLLGLQKAYADDEDFQLTPAQAAQLIAQQAAELEDTDIPPPAQHITPVQPALEPQPSPNVSAAAVVAALETSASMPTAGAASTPTAGAASTLATGAASTPAAGAASMQAAAQGKAAERETSPTPAAPALLQAASVPLTKPPHTATAAKAGRIQVSASVAQAANVLPGQLRHVPHSPISKPSQDLHSAASGSAVTAAGAAPSVVAAAADGGVGGGSCAPSAAMSGGHSQKSGGKVWLPPAALASPQRSSGMTATTCNPETL